MTNPSEADDAAWYDEMQRILEDAYVATDDPRRQSGFGGNAARWERARRPIAAAIHRDGTFLDIGCANGLLMESIAAWAGASGYRVEPFGLDQSPALAALARRRLPDWAAHVFAGNAMTRTPPHRFDFVRTEPVYVPPARQSALVARLLRDCVTPRGRLIVCAYGSASRALRANSVGDILRDRGYAVAGETTVIEVNGGVVTRVAWVDGAPWPVRRYDGARPGMVPRSRCVVRRPRRTW